jgi:hypothetical protein
MTEYLVKCEVVLEIDAENREAAIKRARRWDGCSNANIHHQKCVRPLF